MCGRSGCAGGLAVRPGGPSLGRLAVDGARWSPNGRLAKIDFRLVPVQNPEDIFLKLRRHLDVDGFSDVEVEMLGWIWQARASPDDPFVQLTARAARDVYAGESATCR